MDGGADDDEVLQADVMSMIDAFGLPEDVKQTLRSVMNQSRQSAQSAEDEVERGKPAALTMALIARRCFRADETAGNTPQETSAPMTAPSARSTPTPHTDLLAR